MTSECVRHSLRRLTQIRYLAFSEAVQVEFRCDTRDEYHGHDKALDIILNSLEIGQGARIYRSGLRASGDAWFEIRGVTDPGVFLTTIEHVRRRVVDSTEMDQAHRGHGA